MANIRFEFEGDPSQLVDALQDIQNEVSKTDAKVKGLGNDIDKEMGKKGPSAFEKAERAMGPVNDAFSGLKTSAELAAGAVAAVAGAVTALTKGALDEAKRQVEGLTDATDEQVEASKLLLNQQLQTNDALSSFRTAVLSPLIPVVADTAAGVEALFETLEESGDAEAAGQMLARIYREDLIPALSAFGMTADYVYTGMKAAINQLIGLNKTLFFSLTFQWKKATDAAADVQEGWAGLGDVADRWGEWQDVILETNAALDETVGKSDKSTKKVVDNTSKIEAVLMSLWKTAEDVAFGLMEGDAKVIESGERRKSELESQVYDLLQTVKVTADQREELEMALADALLAIDEETAEELKDRQEERAEEEAERRREENETLLEEYKALQEEKVKLAEEAAERQRQIEMGMLEFSESISGSLADLAAMVADQKVSAAQEGSAEEKKAALEAFEMAKAASIVQALVSTALAVINALATPGVPYPVALAFSIAAGVQGAIQIAAIAAQQPPSLHQGTGLTSDERFTVTRANEGVLTPAAVASLGGMDVVADLNRSRNATGGMAPAQVTTVFRVNNRAVDAMMTENLRYRRGTLYDQFRGVQPTRVKVLGRARPRAYAQAG